jgi:hypothetical protein
MPGFRSTKCGGEPIWVQGDIRQIHRVAFCPSDVLPCCFHGAELSGMSSGSTPCRPDQVKGNRNSMIYHAPGMRDYAHTFKNVECFDTEAAAKAAGYRKAQQIAHPKTRPWVGSPLAVSEPATHQDDDTMSTDDLFSAPPPTQEELLERSDTAYLWVLDESHRSRPRHRTYTPYCQSRKLCSVLVAHTENRSSSNARSPAMAARPLGPRSMQRWRRLQREARPSLRQ